MKTDQDCNQSPPVSSVWREPQIITGRNKPPLRAGGTIPANAKSGTQGGAEADPMRKPVSNRRRIPDDDACQSDGDPLPAKWPTVRTGQSSAPDRSATDATVVSTKGAGPVLPNNGELSPEEREKLHNCERIIERGLTTFVEVGRAILEIRDQRLYRETHSTFEEYCRERLRISPRRAYQLGAAAEVVANLQNVNNCSHSEESASEPSTEVADSAIPANEAQARELAKLPPHDQKIVWHAAVQAAPVGKPTATCIRQRVEDHVRRNKPKQTPPKAPPDAKQAGSNRQPRLAAFDPVNESAKVISYLERQRKRGPT